MESYLGDLADIAGDYMANWGAPGAAIEWVRQAGVAAELAIEPMLAVVVANPNLSAMLAILAAAALWWLLSGWRWRMLAGVLGAVDFR